MWTSADPLGLPIASPFGQTLAFWWRLGNFSENLKSGLILKATRFGQPRVAISMMATLLEVDHFFASIKLLSSICDVVMRCFAESQNIRSPKMLKFQCFLPCSQFWNLVSHSGTCYTQSHTKCSLKMPRSFQLIWFETSIFQGSVSWLLGKLQFWGKAWISSCR